MTVDGRPYMIHNHDDGSVFDVGYIVSLEGDLFGLARQLAGSREAVDSTTIVDLRDHVLRTLARQTHGRTGAVADLDRWLTGRPVLRSVKALQAT